MILYLTYNDQPSGVYWGQVTDAVAHMNTLGQGRVRLVALVSLRNFFATRRAVRQHLPDALVLPMVPRARNWRSNQFWVAWICRLFRPKGIIGRGVFATTMGLNLRDRGLVNKVCFDGRGAYAAEWEEYRIVDDQQLIRQFRPLEARAINDSDLRMAVSEALVEHWRDRYDYDAEHHVVIPCTLDSSKTPQGESERRLARSKYGWKDTDTVMVYSGSTVGWQSLSMLEEVLVPWLGRKESNHMLFLSKGDRQIDELMRRFPDQVSRDWLEHMLVQEALISCDLGILYRENTITNRVASPTKFAEYLASGLPVIISDKLGDLSELVRKERLGQVLQLRGMVDPGIPRGVAERERLRSFARARFSKASYSENYASVLEELHG